MLTRRKDGVTEFLTSGRRQKGRTFSCLFLELKITKRRLKVNKGIFVQNNKKKISSFILIYNILVFLGRLNLRHLKH